ncbi:MAG: chloride channel protein [Planctomycetota bacterium]|nr:chloride channel protein [Planctomycetota bacterium]
MLRPRPVSDDDLPSLSEQLGTILIGLFAGGVAVAFHAVMNLAEETRAELAVLADSHSLLAEAGIVLACGLLAAASVALVRKVAPEAEGSGIAAVLEAQRSPGPIRALRIMWVKFVAGFCGLASGMPLGREGPSVQIGAASAAVWAAALLSSAVALSGGSGRHRGGLQRAALRSRLLV